MRLKKKGPRTIWRCTTWNFHSSRLFFRLKADQTIAHPGAEENYMSLGTIILIILIIALLGGFSGIGGGPFYGTGYYGGGALDW